MRAPLPYLLITVKVTELQKVYFRDKWTQPIQIVVSEKQNSFSIFLSTFPKSTLKFEYFQRKDDPHSLCISEITDSEKGD